MIDPALSGEAAQVAAELDAIQRLACVPSLLKELCEVTGMGFAAIARVSETSWTACAVRDEVNFGLKPGGSLELSTTLCREVRVNRTLIAINHASDDPLYRAHPTPRMYGFESYISVPIVLPDGRYFGNLCALDARPVEVKVERVVSLFTLFAELVGQQLQTELMRSHAEARWHEERATGDLREEFIAVLGHDLRNPLAAIATTAELLARLQSEPRLKELALRIGRNSERMKELIDQLMDFARGRLGGGLGMVRQNEPQLDEALRAVVREVADANPERDIVVDVRPLPPISCDRERMQQLVSNLLGNAVAYGDPGRPIGLRAEVEDSALLLTVSNQGDPIPPDVIGRMFSPFWRRSDTQREGLGLGLHICSEIARGHDGTISVTSSYDRGTEFMVRIPLGDRAVAAKRVDACGDQRHRRQACEVRVAASSLDDDPWSSPDRPAGDS